MNSCVLAGMAGGSVHVQEPLACGHGQLFAPEKVQEAGEDDTEVLRVDRGLLWGHTLVQDDLRQEEGEDHPLIPDFLPLALQGHVRPLWEPL